MQRQTFETSELKAELERSLGFGLKSLDRLDGASALNFKAVRASDGMAFAVKCSPPERRERFENLVRHLADLKGTKAVERLFERECQSTFAGYNVICMSWCPGRRLFPDQLTEAQMVAFLDDYLDFSAVLQKTTGVVPHDPVLAWRREALAKCRGVGGLIVRRLLEKIPEEDLTYRRELIKVVHGDFHHGNFLFVDGRVAGYFDLEEFCEGYPSDDLLRYFCCAADHLKWYELGRKRRMLGLFALAVRRLPYTPHEWLVAINSRFLCRVFMKTHNRRQIGLLPALHLMFRSRFYGSLRRIVSTPA